MLPMFVAEGKDVKVAIPSMPGIYPSFFRQHIKEVKETWDLGIQSG